MSTAMRITIRLDQERLIFAYAEGGWEQQRHVSGIGWVLANEEHWPDARESIEKAAGILNALFGTLRPAWSPPPEKVLDLTSKGSL